MFVGVLIWLAFTPITIFRLCDGKEDKSGDASGDDAMRYAGSTGVWIGLLTEVSATLTARLLANDTWVMRTSSGNLDRHILVPLESRHNTDRRPINAGTRNATGSRWEFLRIHVLRQPHWFRAPTHELAFLHPSPRSLTASAQTSSRAKIGLQTTLDAKAAIFCTLVALFGAGIEIWLGSGRRDSTFGKTVGK
ncbi:hypothetical protein J3R82DRAFT_3748 [Butyriboletus roseoflavus]|nr:hypothetical protein J3R82DRAFT_3748 [Butyriboletus roseoflavus]